MEHWSWMQMPLGAELKHVSAALLSIGIIFVCGLLLRRTVITDHIVPAPKLSLGNVFDVLVEGLYGLCKDVLGPKHAKEHFPFLASLFIFIFINNVLGLLPFGATATSNLATTLGLGVLSFLYYNYHGVKAHGLKGYLAHFLMGMGGFGVIIAAIEMISHLVRPISLAVRLMINMEVDHTLLGTFTSIFEWLLPVPLLLFGLLICTIQAFVFTVLTAVYVQMATEH